MRYIIAIVLSILLSACSGIYESPIKNITNQKSYLDYISKDNPQFITLPVGQGNCQLITCPTSGALTIVDCGSSGANEVALKWEKQYIVKAIKSTFRKTKIDSYNLILTHPDKDHYNYVKSIIKSVSDDMELPDYPRNVYYAGDINDYTVDNTATYLKELSSDGSIVLKALPSNFSTYINPYSQPVKDITTQLSCAQENVTVQIPAANVDYNPGSVYEKNTASITVLTDIKGKRVFLSADMDEKVANFINQNASDAFKPGTFALTAPHHGAAYHDGYGTKWINEHTQPVSVIYSAGAFANYKHPRCSTQDIYATSTATDKDEHDLWCYDQDNKLDKRVSDLTQYNTFNSGAIIYSFSDTQTRISTTKFYQE